MSDSNITTEHKETLSHDAHDHHEQSFISKYVFSMDHKTIAKQFLITGIIWAFIGGFMSLVFRLQLAYPDADLGFLDVIMGKWMDANGHIDNNFYNALITMHGTILVFFVLTAGLSGTFANFLIPLQIGARDMASPFLNMLSYWFFFLASMVMLVSFFVPDGPAAGGWTAYPPLSYFGGQGLSLWLISLALFVVSTLMGGLNYITTVLNLRTKGMSMFKMPLTIWSLFFTAVIGLLSFPVLVAGFVLLIFDRSLGTSFYLSDMFANGEFIAKGAGSPILYEHLFWFLGHPEVYIIILPAMGIVSEVMSVNARKPIFGYRAMIYSITAITVLSFIVWAHHMFVSGLNPFVGSIFVLFTLMIAVPSAIKVFNWLTTLWRGNLRLTPAMMFAIGFVSFFISGGLTGLFLGNSTTDIQLHDTYFVVAHFHIVMGVSAFFGMFAGVYHWFPKMFGRFMNRSLGYIHFWATLIGANLIFMPMHYLGLAGIPRRYPTFDNFDSFSQFADLNIFMTMAAFLGVFAQVVFAFNFFYSIYKGRKVTEKNPWKANSLEWTTPIKPGHGNWPGEIPEVYRWPYDYGKDGKDFIPQTVPYGPDESPEPH
jgi:cytochrome c oxidase subunit I